MKRKAFSILLAALLLFAVVPQFSSCGTQQKAQTSATVNSPTAVQNRIWVMGKNHPDGFTVDVRTMEEPTEGIAVAYAETQGAHTKKEIYGVAAHALSHEGYVGGWKDTDTGKYYYDSVKLFPEDQLNEALKFARQNGQKSVYIISTGQEIRLADQTTPHGERGQ